MSTTGRETTTVVTARRILLDAYGPAIQSGGVLVSGETIIAVGTQSEMKDLSGDHTKHIDLGDVTLLPGLIDCHVHLGYDTVQSRALLMQDALDELQLATLMLHNARKLLKAGVTTIRELGSKKSLGSLIRDTIIKGWAPGPRVLAANEPITTTGGHAWFLGGECDSADEIKKSVRNHKKSNSDLIKIMVTGGGLTLGSMPWRAQFSLEEIQTAVAEASRLGMPVAAHVHGTDGITIATRAGVSTLEHCTWMGPGGEIGREFDEGILDEIVERGIFVCPTASSRWSTMNHERLVSKIKTVSMMHKAGVRLIAGTDAGIEHVPHENYAQGLLWLKECGLSNEEILNSATLLAAEACGISEVTGSLTVGKSADMIAVEGDPRSNLECLSQPKWVIANGTQITSNGRFQPFGLD